MELAFISPCSILYGRHLHFPKVCSPYLSLKHIQSCRTEESLFTR